MWLWNHYTWWQQNCRLHCLKMLSEIDCLSQLSINHKQWAIYSKKNYTFERNLFSSINFKKQPSYASIKERESLIWKGKLLERKLRNKHTYKHTSRIPAQVLPLLLDEGSHPTAPQQTKPLENKYNEDVLLCWSSWAQYKINFIIKWLICQGKIPPRII